MFHFPKIAKLAGDQNCVIVYRKSLDQGGHGFYLSSVQVYDTDMFCGCFFIPILQLCFFPSVFFCGLSHVHTCHSQASPANTGRKISLFINLPRVR